MSHVSTAPVTEGETHHVEIEELGDEGDGVAYIEGFVVFVPDTDLTASVEIEINTVEESFAIASVLDQQP